MPERVRRVGAGVSAGGDAALSAPVSAWRPALHAVPAGTWSAQRVVAALRDWRGVTGARPRIYEWSPANARAFGLYNANCRRWEREHPRWPSAQTVIAYFGSWSEGLEAAGMNAPRRRPPLPLAERVAAARRLAAQGMRQREIADLLEVCPSTVSTYLAAGSCACGEPVIRARSLPARCRACARRASVRRAWDRATILAAYRAWQAETGSRPFRNDWSPESPRSHRWHREYPRWPSAGEVCAVYARWGELVRAAGDPPAQRRWTREEVLAALDELAADVGRSPRATDLPGWPGMPGAGTVRALFGSWRAALGELGMAPDRSRYGDEELLDVLRRVRRRDGRSPRPADLDGKRPGAETIRRRFGSWMAALDAAGIEPVTRPGRDAVIAALRADAAAAGGLAPTSTRWRRREPPSEWDVLRLFGSWTAGLRAAGLTPRTRVSPAARHAARRPAPETWTRELVIARLHEWSAEVGRPPTRAEWSATQRAARHLRPAADKRHRQRPRWPTAGTVARVCGSWAAALRDAGLAKEAARPWESGLADRVRLAQRLRAHGLLLDDVAVHLGVSKWMILRYQRAAPCPSCGEPVVEAPVSGLCVACRPPARRPAWTRERIVEAIRAWEREVGAPPAAGEWGHRDPPGRWGREHPRFPSYEQVCRRFESWGAALEEAGTRAKYERWTRERVVAALRRWADAHGRPPTQGEWSARRRERDATYPHAGVAAQHFSSWSAALRAAGLTPGVRPWTDEQILDALRAWEQRHGRAPTSGEWARVATSDTHPARGTIVNHFGSWVQALDAAGLTPRRQADRERLSV